MTGPAKREEPMAAKRKTDVDLPPGVRRVEKEGKPVPGWFTIRAQGRGYNVQKTVKARTANDAYAQIADLRREATAPKVEPVPEIPALPTLAAFAHSYMRSRIQGRELKTSTAKFYALALDHHILPTLGHLQIDEIRKVHVLDWMEAQAGATDSVNARFRVLRTITRAAVDRHELPRDPTAGIKARRRTEPVREKSIGVDELEKLIAAVRSVSPKWYPLVLVLARTGMRFSEASALQWSDIDHGAGTITIRRGQWRGHIGTPKTGRSRVVAMTPDLAAVLREHRDRQVREQAPELHEGWLFMTQPRNREETLPSDRRHLQPGSLRKPLETACKAAGIGVKFTPHCFRHTLNNALRQHDPLGLVTQSAIGHSGTAMTARYSNVALAEQSSLLQRAIPAAFLDGQSDCKATEDAAGSISLDPAIANS